MMPETKTKSNDSEVVDETTEESKETKETKETKPEKGKGKPKGKKEETETKDGEVEDEVKDVKFLQNELESSQKKHDEQFAEIIELKKTIEDLKARKTKEDEEETKGEEKEIIDVQAEYERLIQSQAEKDEENKALREKIRKDNITKALEKNLSKENLNDNIPSELLIPYLIDRYQFNYDLNHDTVFYKEGKRTMVVSDALTDMKSRFPKLFRQLKYKTPIREEIRGGDDMKSKLLRRHAVGNSVTSFGIANDFTPDEKRAAYNSMIKKKE